MPTEEVLPDLILRIGNDKSAWVRNSSSFRRHLFSGRIGVYQGREPCKSMSTNFRAFAGQSSALPAVERP
jgi:hypothetical protein